MEIFFPLYISSSNMVGRKVAFSCLILSSWSGFQNYRFQALCLARLVYPCGHGHVLWWNLLHLNGVLASLSITKARPISFQGRLLLTEPEKHCAQRCEILCRAIPVLIFFKDLSFQNAETIVLSDGLFGRDFGS